MKKLIKKAIVCSLVAGFLQYGLSTSLVKAAPQDDPSWQNQQNQQQQDQKRREEQQRKDPQHQGQQRPGQPQDQQHQDRQRPNQPQQDQQWQNRQRQQQQDQQHQDQQRQQQQQQDQQRQDQQRQQQQQQDQQHRDQQRQQDEQQYRDQRRHDWSQDAYRNDNWHGTSRQYNESSPFRWHESRSSMNERFSSDYRMNRIDDDAWNNRFPGLHSYRYNQGDFWYRGVRVRDAVLFYDDSDELVGTGFMFNNEFVFIRDDQQVYHRNDSLLLQTISVLLKL